MLKSLVAALIATLVSGAALAQTAPPSTLRGTIESVAADGASMIVHARNGQSVTVRLKPDLVVTLVVPASLNSVKPDSYIGVGAAPGPDGKLNALEVHVFPESARGVGEGSRPFDLVPGSSMTNGSLAARVDAMKGETLIVSYAGGSQTIHIDPNTPVVTFAPGEKTLLKAGAAIVARGSRAEDGAFDAARVLIGKDGLTPPM